HIRRICIGTARRDELAGRSPSGGSTSGGPTSGGCAGRTSDRAGRGGAGERRSAGAVVGPGRRRRAHPGGQARAAPARWGRGRSTSVSTAACMAMLLLQGVLVTLLLAMFLWLRCRAAEYRARFDALDAAVDDVLLVES